MEQQYRIIERRSHLIREDQLQRLWEEGWELVSIVPTDGSFAFFFYFKRRSIDLPPLGGVRAQK